MKLPDSLRPYVGGIVGSVVTIAIAQIATKVPVINAFVTPETANHITDGVLGYLFAHTATTKTNATINPTQAATSTLAGTVPAVVNPKSQGSTVTQ